MRFCLLLITQIIFQRLRRRTHTTVVLEYKYNQMRWERYQHHYHLVHAQVDDNIQRYPDSLTAVDHFFYHTFITINNNTQHGQVRHWLSDRPTLRRTMMAAIVNGTRPYRGVGDWLWSLLLHRICTPLFDDECLQRKSISPPQSSSNNRMATTKHT